MATPCGSRAIRRCLKEPQDFMPQLLAILRASAFGPVRIMIPMLTNIDELNQVLRLIDEAKQLLKKKNIAFEGPIDLDTIFPLNAEN